MTAAAVIRQSQSVKILTAVAYHFVIDGYNVLYAMAEIPAGTWQQKREKFLEFLRQRRPQGKNRLTIVFDSREGIGDQSQQGDIRIIFTSGETADDRISALVRQARNPREVVVVSNDRGLRTLVRGTGVKFLSATEFLMETSPRPRPPADVEPLRSPDADKINEEFKKKWL